ncbi:MAG: hypothetical protein WCF95_06395 [bacterium]
MVNSIAFRALTTQVPPPNDEKYLLEQEQALKKAVKDEASKVAKKAVEKVPMQYGAIEQAKKLDLMA